jgi:Exonuclease VII, large subunit
MTHSHRLTQRNSPSAQYQALFDSMRSEPPPPPELPDMEYERALARSELRALDVPQKSTAPSRLGDLFARTKPFANYVVTRSGPVPSEAMATPFPTLPPLPSLPSTSEAMTLTAQLRGRRDNRERLQAAGVFDAQRKLESPWDFNHVLVIVPSGATDLWNFRARADRLQAHGLCQFTYEAVNFQGQQAAADISNVLHLAATAWSEGFTPTPDAVVIVRGAEPVGVISWLNDFDLARQLCELTVPVLTGIGLERDSTLLDEVAHQKFDTPCQLIAGIEGVIRDRATDAKATREWMAGQMPSRFEHARSFRDAFGLMCEHASAMRGQQPAQAADVLDIVTESVDAYRICQSRIDAVEAAWKAPLVRSAQPVPSPAASNSA